MDVQRGTKRKRNHRRSCSKQRGMPAASAAARIGRGNCTDSLRAAAALADRLLDAGCVRFGQFTLKSGLQSPIYLDLRQIISDPALLAEVADAYVRLLRGLHFDRLAGLPYAGLPIAIGCQPGGRLADDLSAQEGQVLTASGPGSGWLRAGRAHRGARRPGDHRREQVRSNRKTGSRGPGHRGRGGADRPPIWRGESLAVRATNCTL